MLFGEIGALRDIGDPYDPRRRGPMPLSGFEGQFSGLTPAEQAAVRLPRRPAVVAVAPGELVGTTAMPDPLVIQAARATAAPQEYVQLPIPGPQTVLAQTGRSMDWIRRAGLSGARFAPAPQEAIIASSVRPGLYEAAVPVAEGQLALPLQQAMGQAGRVAALSQELGIPERTAAWLIAREAAGPVAERKAMGARSPELVRSLVNSGAIPPDSVAANAPLGAIVASTGEVREDPLNRALRALNARLFAEGDGTFMDEGGYQRSLETGAIADTGDLSPTARVVDAADLSPAELAAMMPESRQAAVLPYAARALSAAETQAAFQESGASKTRGGQRNSFAKAPNAGFQESESGLYPGTTLLRSRRGSAGDPDDRYTWFTPGGVSGAGIEPDPRAATIPLLVAPASQERWSGTGFQAPSVYLKGAGGFVTGLDDARILDVNPLAELSPSAAAALGLYTNAELDKVETGGYAGRATNAPIPDSATGGGGLDPNHDPAAMGGSGAKRSMTIAEAVAQIANRNRAPITPIAVNEYANRRGHTRLPQLRDDGMIAITSPTGETTLVPVYPLGTPGPDEKDLSPVQRLRLQAERSGSDFVDARIGSKGRYTDGLYRELDQLFGVLASEAFPDARARYQLQAVSSDLGTKALNLVEDRYKPVVIERPVGSDWSLLINTANKKDELIPRYQRELLARAGMELPVEGNPLMALVDRMSALAGVPVGEIPLTAAASAQRRVQSDPAALELALAIAKQRGRSAAGGQMIPSETGRGRFAPDTNSFPRKALEESARATLAGVLSGQIPLPQARGAASAVATAAVGQELGRRRDWIDERPARPVVAGGAQEQQQERENPYSRRRAEEQQLLRIAGRATPATVLAAPPRQGWISGLQVPYAPQLHQTRFRAASLGTPGSPQGAAASSPRPVRRPYNAEDPNNTFRGAYLNRLGYVEQLDRLAEAAGGPSAVVVGPSPVYQQELPLRRPDIAAGLGAVPGRARTAGRALYDPTAWWASRIGRR